MENFRNLRVADTSCPCGVMEEKTCASCGRRIEWRRKWKNCWDQVRFCSAACRRRGAGDGSLEKTILDLLDGRARGATLCPSEAARRHFSEAWRGRMEDVRRAARRLVAQGRVEIVQGGQVVDPSSARGAIRIRRVD